MKIFTISILLAIFITLISFVHVNDDPRFFKYKKVTKEEYDFLFDKWGTKEKVNNFYLSLQILPRTPVDISNITYYSVFDKKISENFYDYYDSLEANIQSLISEITFPIFPKNRYFGLNDCKIYELEMSSPKVTIKQSGFVLSLPLPKNAIVKNEKTSKVILNYGEELELYYKNAEYDCITYKLIVSTNPQEMSIDIVNASYDSNINYIVSNNVEFIVPNGPYVLDIYGYGNFSTVVS